MGRHPGPNIKIDKIGPNQSEIGRRQHGGRQQDLAKGSVKFYIARQHSLHVCEWHLDSPFPNLLDERLGHVLMGGYLSRTLPSHLVQALRLPRTAFGDRGKVQRNAEAKRDGHVRCFLWGGGA